MRYYLDQSGIQPFVPSVNADKLFEHLTGYDSDANMNFGESGDLERLLDHPRAIFTNPRNQSNASLVLAGLGDATTCYLQNFFSVYQNEAVVVFGMKYKYTGYLLHLMVVPQASFDALLRKHFIDEFLSENP